MKFKNMVGYVSYHSYSELILYPYGIKVESNQVSRNNLMYLGLIAETIAQERKIPKTFEPKVEPLITFVIYALYLNLA